MRYRVARPRAQRRKQHQITTKTKSDERILSSTILEPYCTPKSIIGSADFDTIEAANKEYNRVMQLGYRAELAKITIIK